jgi:hypothetical protein
VPPEYKSTALPLHHRSQEKNLILYDLFSFGATDQTGPRPHRLRFLDHTQLDTHTPSRTPLKEWAARHRGRYVQNTQQTPKTHIHALSGIWTLDPGNQAAADIRLRPHHYKDRHCTILQRQSSSCVSGFSYKLQIITHKVEIVFSLHFSFVLFALCLVGGDIWHFILRMTWAI